MNPKVKQLRKERRRGRSRSQLLGTATRPRLSVFRGLRTMFIQLLDDENSVTLASVNSKSIDDKIDAGERSGKVAQGYRMGSILAAKAKKKGIKSIVFDRSGYKYHGRVKAVAEGARDGGLEF